MPLACPPHTHVDQNKVPNNLLLNEPLSGAIGDPPPFTRKFAQWILNGAGSRRRNKSAERAASNQALTNDV